jgi:hypothetical protein
MPQYRPTPTEQPSIGTPLQATLGYDRFPLGPAPKLDVRNAAAETLAAYLGGVIFVIAGGKAEDKEFRLSEVLPNWPEADVELKYPSASIDDGPAPYEAHDFVPTMQEDTYNVFCPGTVIWKTGELVVEFQVDFWTNTEATRQAIAAGLPRIFNPTETRSGVLLAGHPDYFHRAVRCTLLDVDRNDGEDSTYDRERRLRTVVKAEIDVVHLRQVSQLAPDVILDVQE